MVTCKEAGILFFFFLNDVTLWGALVDPYLFFTVGSIRLHASVTVVTSSKLFNDLVSSVFDVETA